MGYKVQSIFSIAPNDNHAFFFYFIPTHLMEYEWVNVWLTNNFDKIATKVGPKGVIISPTKAKTEDYIESVFQESGGGCVFCVLNGFDSTSEILHSGFPFLIISRYPLNHSEKQNDAVIMNMAAYEDKNKLAKAFDILIKMVEEDDWDKINEIKNEKPVKFPSNWSHVLNETIEIKPNIFGIGINFNNVLKELAKTIIKERN